METAFSELGAKFRKTAPWPLLFLARKVRRLPEDLPHILRFVLSSTRTPTSLRQRLGLVFQCYRISYRVDCRHMENEMIRVMRAIFETSPETPGVIVEAGCFKGGSSAKISLAARIAGRTLCLFDSFEGLPANDEEHGKNIFGGDADFPQGGFRGALDEVRENLRSYGAIDTCKFVKGWFEESMPHFREPVAVAFMDVDLRSSTATCLKYLYPLLTPGGVVFSQDGHLPLVIGLLNDDSFWKDELGVTRPQMTGLHTAKLVEMRKPS
jgi:O-methyltransferase